ncbi:transcription initiation protein spt4 [Hyaloraphidium curvatum]|nr:transcription initiation protein spt4 [Hyaloraphidium curvatum]
MAAAPGVPKERAKLRACMLCGLLKTAAQFKRDGCDNCEELLHYRGSSSSVQSCTTDKFEGMIGLFQPDNSWAARNLNIEKFVRGMYAVRVVGRLPEDIEDRLRDEGYVVYPRDGSTVEGS